jgi:hypothetical protein
LFHISTNIEMKGASQAARSGRAWERRICGQRTCSQRTCGTGLAATDMRDRPCCLKARAEPVPFSFLRREMERREAPGGLRDPLVARLARPRLHAGPKQICETCSEARAPDRAGFARPDAAALRLPALHHRAGHRPDCHEAQCRRPALPARPGAS